jgi:hypothetical protein
MRLSRDGSIKCGETLDRMEDGAYLLRMQHTPITQREVIDYFICDEAARMALLDAIFDTMRFHTVKGYRRWLRKQVHANIFPNV